MRGGSKRLELLIKLEQKLSEIDRRVLETIHRLTLVSGAQIRRLHFNLSGNEANDSHQARRGLLRLTQLGLLDRLERRIGGIASGSEGFCYRLAADGQRLVHWWRRGDATPERLRPEPGERFVHHRLSVSELYVLFVEACRAGRNRNLEVIEFEAEPDSWRPYDSDLSGRRHVLKPDAFLKLGVGEFEHWWFCEMDLGSVSRRARESQAAAYRHYWRSGAAGPVMPRVLWVAPNELVEEKARVAIKPSAEPHGLFVVTSLDNVTEAALMPLGGEAS